MKIKELINKINKRRTVKAEYRKYYDGSYYDGSLCNITIGTKDLNPCNQWFFSFGTDCYSWAGVAKNYDWLTNSVSADDLAYVVVAINEFMDTPVKDRFPEKRYRLRWLDDKDGTPEYIDFDSNAGWNMWGDKNATDTFTELQLDQLKRDHPLFASVIDIMKEPVEEEGK